MDAEEIARLVSEMKVSQEAREKTVTITRGEAERGQQRLEKSLVGKIFSRKATNKETLKSNLPRILRVRGSTEIEVIGQNLFVIYFALESDKRMVLNEGPWHYFQDLLILKQANPMQPPTEVVFDEITMWVQCHNVPIDCMEPTVIERVGAQVGRVEEIDMNEGGLCMGKFARVRVTRPINDPLLRCVPLRQEGLDTEVFILLQYEGLPDFCFHCGRVGHISRECAVSNIDKSNPKFDSWLRAGKVFATRSSGNPRPGTGTSDSEGSGSGWGLVKAGNSGSGTPITSRVDEREKEVIASEGRDESVEEREEGVRLGGEGKEVSENDMLVSMVEGGESGAGGRDNEVRKEGGKGAGCGLSPIKLRLSSNRLGGKGWKRQAREKKVAGVRVGSGGSPESKGGNKLRKRVAERDGANEGEFEVHRLKVAKLCNQTLMMNPTAAAAGQPRRSP